MDNRKTKIYIPESNETRYIEKTANHVSSSGQKNKCRIAGHGRAKRDIASLKPRWIGKEETEKHQFI